MLSYNNVKHNCQSIVITDFDVAPDTVIEFTILYHGCALYLYVVLILYDDIQYLMECDRSNTTICDKRNRIDSNCDHDLVHYGVVYVYVHAYYVVQLLLYNIQRSSGCNNSNITNCDNNNLRYTAIKMAKKIDSIGIIDDNNFSFESCNIMQCDYVNNICTYVNNIHTHSIYHGCDDARELVFDTKYKTARDNNQRTT